MYLHSCRHIHFGETSPRRQTYRCKDGRSSRLSLQVSLASKMATLPKALELLEEIRSASYPAAEKDMEEVRAFAKEQGADYELQHWDVTFWAERLREQK